MAGTVSHDFVDDVMHVGARVQGGFLELLEVDVQPKVKEVEIPDDGAEISEVEGRGRMWFLPLRESVASGQRDQVGRLDDAGQHGVRCLGVDGGKQGAGDNQGVESEGDKSG